MENMSRLIQNAASRFLVLAFLLLFMLTSCSEALETAVPTITLEPIYTVSIVEASETPTSIPEPTPNPSNQELLQFGPYYAGKSTFEFIDTSRDDRSVNITVFYPALTEREGSYMYIAKDAEPDFSAAPYPAILSSTKMANQLAPYLVSHGFTWIGVNGIDTYMKLNAEIYQQPLDLLFALDQVAENPPAGLEGLINTDVVGSIGYSFDGNNALTLSGARIDSSLYLSNCADPDNIPDWGDMSCFSCSVAQDWETFKADAEQVLTIDDDGIWQAITDQRIKAFMPLATEGYWLFDLSLIDQPILMIDSSEDSLYRENVLIFEDLPSEDKTFITILNEDHMMIYDPDIVAQLAYFATAFFGYHLQGYENYQEYLSEGTISNLEGIQWGVMNAE